MIVFLRLLSITNAAIWCGAGLFAIIALPAIFSDEVKRILTDRYVGFAAQAVLERYFILQYCCAGVALGHLVTERLYLGRPAPRFTLWLLTGMTCFVLLGGLVFQPKIRQLYRAKYWGPTIERRVEAAASFVPWHATSQIANLLVVAGSFIYFWKLARSADNSRFVGLNKIRS